MSTALSNKIGKTALTTVSHTAAIMIVLTFGSKIFGFLREMALAAYFGSSYVVDAYVIAYNIPNIIFAGILVSIGTAYMPLFSKIIEHDGEHAGNIFTSQILNIIVILSIIFTIFGIVFSDKIVSVFAPGFAVESAKLTSFFLKVTFSFTLLTSIIRLFESYLQYKNTFLPQIFVDYIQNIAVIIAILISAKFGSYLLIFGLFIGYIFKCAILYILAKKINYHYIRSFKKILKVVKSIIPLTIPVFFATFIQQVNVFVDRSLASSLQEGSISALFYANQINMLIITISVTILTTLIYPKLTQANTINNIARFDYMLQKGFNLILIITIPCSLGAMIYSKEVVQIIYERGAFNSDATLLTSTAYFYYSIGLVFIALNDLMTRAYYALQLMRAPMYFAAISVVINIVLSIVLVRYMKHGGLALATSIAVFSNTILLYYNFKKNVKNYKLLESRKNVLLISLSSVIAIGISYFIYYLTLRVLNFPLLVTFFFAMLSGVSFYLFLLYIFRIDEYKYFKSLLKIKVK